MLTCLKFWGVSNSFQILVTNIFIWIPYAPHKKFKCEYDNSKLITWWYENDMSENQPANLLNWLIKPYVSFVEIIWPLPAATTPKPKTNVLSRQIVFANWTLSMLCIIQTKPKNILFCYIQCYLWVFPHPEVLLSLSLIEFVNTVTWIFVYFYYYELEFECISKLTNKNCRYFWKTSE